ncbi:MAG: PAQR family membrane homeostasis protein TrhA [Actinomycetota bacterium]
MSIASQEIAGSPRMRGRLHQIAFICSIPMGMTLVALGRTGLARVATSIYAVSMSALFGVSASYHRLNWSPRARQWMRKLDHSTIFLLIAGSYTPFSLLALRGAWRVWILSAVWGVALLGILLMMIRIERMDRAGMVLYLALGWTALIALPQLLSHLSVSGTVLLFAGGVLYTVGAVMFALHRPNPNPRVFGYHEIWHSMVIGGSLCHYVTILLLAMTAR